MIEEWYRSLIWAFHKCYMRVIASNTTEKKIVCVHPGGELMPAVRNLSVSRLMEAVSTNLEIVSPHQHANGPYWKLLFRLSYCQFT